MPREPISEICRLFAGRLPLVAVLLGGGALAAFRGCPKCWLVGLLEAARTATPPLPASRTEGIVLSAEAGYAPPQSTVYRAAERTAAPVNAGPSGSVSPHDLRGKQS